MKKGGFVKAPCKRCGGPAIARANAHLEYISCSSCYRAHQAETRRAWKERRAAVLYGSDFSVSNIKRQEVKA